MSVLESSEANVAGSFLASLSKFFNADVSGKMDRAHHKFIAFSVGNDVTRNIFWRRVR